MKRLMISLCWWVALQSTFSKEISLTYENNSEANEAINTARGRRDVIEEEKFYNIRSETRKDVSQPTPWMPGPLPPVEDPTTKVSNEIKDVLPLYLTTERVTDKPTGRGARASNENWIKLPFPGREENDRDRERDILTPPQPSGELLNSRMPRVNFVTQNKALETSESRNDKESIQRATRNDDLRTEFVRPGEDDRAKHYTVQKPVFPRQAVYYPEESRRPFFYDDRYFPADDYRRDSYIDPYDRRRYTAGYAPPIDRYDSNYDSYIPRKPKRIIYYAHLPEVVRTPPSVDLRYRYSSDPYRRYEDDGYGRSGRYDYRFRSRYPYAPLRKDDRIYRDLAGAGTANKDKKIDEKVTAAPVLPQQKDDKFKPAPTSNPNRNLINSHQYHDGIDLQYNEPLSHKSFPDIMRPDDSYLRFEEPLFQSAIDDPYRQKY